MRSLTGIMLFLMFLSLSYGQSYKQVKIFITSPGDITLLAGKGLAVEDSYFDQNENSISMVLDEKEFDQLLKLGLKYEVIIPDWISYTKSLKPLSNAEIEKILSVSREKYNVSHFGFGSFTGYYNLKEVTAQLDSMHSLFPSLISEKKSIGTTHENRPIYCVTITGPGITKVPKPQSLYTAMHHGREPEGMMVLIYFMYYLLENYNTDPTVKYLLDNREIYFIPVVNPDGYNYNEVLYPNGSGLWRKNKRLNPDGSYGVDLNRNYGPFEYWDAANGNSSTDYFDATYRGPEPFSEPETRAIRDFLKEHKIKTCLNYHSAGGYYIYPYGARDYETADSLLYRDYARDMSYYNHYKTGRDMETVRYPTRGTSDDFMYDGDSSRGKILPMIPEVGKGWVWATQDKIFSIVESNLYPNLYYTWVTGGFVKMKDYHFSQQYFNPGDNAALDLLIMNKGLETAYSTVTKIISLTDGVTIAADSFYNDMIKRRDTVILHSGISISSKLPVKSTIYIQVKNMTGDAVMSSDTIKIIPGTPAIADKSPLQYKFTLSPNYPNPFNPTTTISYSLPKVSKVELKVYDMLGREAATLVSKVQEAGNYKVQFDGSSLPSGVYIYTIKSGEFSSSKKLMLVK